MPFEMVEPSELLDVEIDAVIVGWHCHGVERSSETLYLRLLDGDEIEAYTAGSGDLVLRHRTVPADFSMDEYGRVEFREAEADEPALRLSGQTIHSVEQITWRGMIVGYRLGTARGAVVLFNDCDELFTSHGALPPGYDDAVMA